MYILEYYIIDKRGNFIHTKTSIKTKKIAVALISEIPLGLQITTESDLNYQDKSFILVSRTKIDTYSNLKF